MRGLVVAGMNLLGATRYQSSLIPPDTLAFRISATPSSRNSVGAEPYVRWFVPLRSSAFCVASQEKEVVMAHMKKMLGPMMSYNAMFSNATIKLMKLQTFEVGGRDVF